MVNATATILGDVQYTQNGTVTNPWIISRIKYEKHGEHEN